VFPKTNVVYIGLERGADEMRAMHEAMNTGPLAFNEPHIFHPHITLAQEFDAADTPRLWALARKRWQAYAGPRAFRAETVAFVQNTAGNSWLDLAEFSLGLPAPVRKLRK
jgi:2'-5' RNA ligase